MRYESQHGGTLTRSSHMDNEHWEHEKKRYFLEIGKAFADLTKAGHATEFRLERFETETQLRVVLFVYSHSPLPEGLVELFTRESLLASPPVPTAHR